MESLQSRPLFESVYHRISCKIQEPRMFFFMARALERLILWNGGGSLVQFVSESTGYISSIKNGKQEAVHVLFFVEGSLRL